MHYQIRPALERPKLDGNFDGPGWRNAQIAKIDQFHVASSEHRPATEAKIVYDDAGLYVVFRVRDRYVTCTRTQNQELTSKDSCVEVYFQPSDDPSAGYLNFEMNCGGTLLLFWITDPTRCDPGIFKAKELVPQSLIDT